MGNKRWTLHWYPSEIPGDGRTACIKRGALYVIEVWQPGGDSRDHRGENRLLRELVADANRGSETNRSEGNS